MTSAENTTRRRRGASIPIFGILVTTVGIIVLLNTFGVLEWTVWLDMWRLWPVLLVLFGVKFIFPAIHPLLVFLISAVVIAGAILFAFTASENNLFDSDFTTFTYDLESNDEADALVLNLDFGAGTLRVRPLVATDDRLVAAEFFDDEDDIEVTSEINNGTQEVTMQLDTNQFPFFGRSGSGREWTVYIHPDVETALSIDGGAGRFDVDLENMNVTEFDINVGAADLSVTTPAAAGHVSGDIKAGAADIRVTVPDGTDARINNDSGVSSVDISSSRFPKTGDVHESEGYNSATNRLDLSIGAGVSNITVE